MKGWKIAPLGWLLLAILIGLAIYFGGRWVYRRLWYPTRDQADLSS